MSRPLAIYHPILTAIHKIAPRSTPMPTSAPTLGVARVSVGSGPMRAALAVVRDVARELKTTGTYRAFTTHAMAFNEVNELMK